MAGWRDHDGVYHGAGIALPIDGIDTDQIIPARFMSTPREQGYGDFLMHDLRFDHAGKPINAFPLNRHREATVLVAGRNFGSGSSREAAVYALMDYGFKTIIAPSFGDIFAANAVNNGVLPAAIEEGDARLLAEALADRAMPVAIDLKTQTITCADLAIEFEIEAVWRTKLLEGWDDIDLTANHKHAITTFHQADAIKRSWAQLQGEPQS